MWPERKTYTPEYMIEPSKTELEAQITEVRETYRADLRNANRRHAENVRRIRKHRDDMLEILRREIDAATK